MGEIGGNDYNDPFLQGHSIEEIQSFVPNVVATIGAAINVRTKLIIASQIEIYGEKVYFFCQLFTYYLMFCN